MNTTLALETKHLTKAFAGKEVIRNCHIKVSKGSIYGLVGANGAGKTTLFKLLACLMQPTMGEVFVLGKQAAGQQTDILKQIGTVIAPPAFYEHLSAAHNLHLHLAYMGVDAEQADIPSLLAKVGLSGAENQPVSEFSLGMRQRLAIARAISHRPQLLILDEPVNGLDPMGMRDMRRLFRELVDSHQMTLLLSSHLLSEMELLADTIGFMIEGTIVKEVVLSDIKENHPEGLEEYFINLVAEKNCVTNQ